MFVIAYEVCGDLAMNNNIQGKYVVLIYLYAGYTKTK
jgi:hypothetical protein